MINEIVAGKRREQVFIFNGAAREVVWAFWKTLRDMESKQSKEEYEKQWEEAFPEREMCKLTRRVKEVKSKAV